MPTSFPQEWHPDWVRLVGPKNVQSHSLGDTGMLGTPGSDARFPARCPLASLARLDPGIVLGLATESCVRQMRLGRLLLLLLLLLTTFLGRGGGSHTKFLGLPLLSSAFPLILPLW